MKYEDLYSELFTEMLLSRARSRALVALLREAGLDLDDERYEELIEAERINLLTEKGAWSEEVERFLGTLADVMNEQHDD